jgi:hypothetical protein
MKRRAVAMWIVCAVSAAAAVLTGCGGGSSNAATPSVLGETVEARDASPPDEAVGSAATATSIPTTPAPGVVTTVVAPPVPPSTKIALSRTLIENMVGDDVAYLQQRLHDLHFDPGPIDGHFGPATTMALWAYQKLVGLKGAEVTGTLTPEFWSAMQDRFVIAPMQPDGGANHLEVDLVRQVAVLWGDGATPKLITHISTGSGKDWCENGFCGVATTPAGVYKFFRRVSGWRQSELGLLYNPVYFNEGIAVHGAPSVPLYPASHGCVRIPMHISIYFPTLVSNTDAVYVFDGKKAPGDYGSPPPPRNTIDPNAPPTTTVPTTTVPTTTTNPTPSTGTVTSSASSVALSTTVAPGTTVPTSRSTGSTQAP